MKERKRATLFFIDYHKLQHVRTLEEIYANPMFTEKKSAFELSRGVSNNQG